MFPEGMPDLQSLMDQAAEMQRKVLEAQAELAETRVVGTAGGGLVIATVTGTGDLVGLTIDPQVVDPDDTETLADLVVAAIRDAGNGAQALAADQLGDLTGGFGASPGDEDAGPALPGGLGF